MAFFPKDWKKVWNASFSSRNSSQRARRKTWYISQILAAWSSKGANKRHKNPEGNQWPMEWNPSVKAFGVFPPWTSITDYDDESDSYDSDDDDDANDDDDDDDLPLSVSYSISSNVLFARQLNSIRVIALWLYRTNLELPKDLFQNWNWCR